ncbi:hypothetical protein HK096_011030, partial [Nowakowskiella sp. JEL0078]
MRIVCHCKDCRGYYNFLNNKSGDKLSPLEPCGGIDLTQIYNSELKIEQGKEYLKVLKKTPGGLARVYASCCYTPIYSSGMVIIVNTNLIPINSRLPICFQIIGRDALKPHTINDLYSSVPWFWPFKMIGRLSAGNGKGIPEPFDLKSIEHEVFNFS